MSQNPIKKLFGGLKMSWPFVILFAAVTALFASVFLTVPFLADTSLHRMGVYFEAWIFFAIIIMSNCKKPLESALKTFVFFLISQPLIYLLQVPFSDMGFGIFMYYRYWFILTLLTFPMAFVGWFITKKNWFSVLILSPALAYLGMIVYETFMNCIYSFPNGLIALVFCVAQIVMYIYVFMPKTIQKVVGSAIPVAVIIFLIIFNSVKGIDMVAEDLLPDDVSYSDGAVIEVKNTEIADIEPKDLEAGIIRISVHSYGNTEFTVTDGEKTDVYILEVENSGGSPKISISSAEQ